MKLSSLVQKLTIKEQSITLEHIFEKSKAVSGGDRDLNFLKYLIESGVIIHGEASLKRTNLNLAEEYYQQRYKKMNMESDRHFLCRTIILEELKRLGFEAFNGIDAGNMQILRSNSNYDIITEDFQCIIDVGLAPARNYFRGLTDLRTVNYMITSFFDDYNDDVLFSIFSRNNDHDFLEAVKDYES